MPFRIPTFVNPLSRRLTASRSASNEKQSHKFYDTRWWRRERKRFLDANPICAMIEHPSHCGECTRAATVVDHVRPIEAGCDPRDSDNWRALCLIAANRITANYRITGRNEMP